MLNKHPALGAFRELLRPDAKAPGTAEPALDATIADRQKDEDKMEEVYDSAGDYASSDIALKAVAAVHEFAETGPDDLDEGETLGDRLFGLLMGIADADKDGEISEEEADLLSIAMETAVDYLVAKGVPEDDAVALMTDFDPELAANIQELVIAKLPDGEDEALEDIDTFVFGDGSDESAFDSAALDAVYKKKLVIRKGKKVRINKRVSGKVRLSAKQKVAIRKMLRKSHSAKAQMRRAKSVKIRQRSGL